MRLLKLLHPVLFLVLVVASIRAQSLVVSVDKDTSKLEILEDSALVKLAVVNKANVSGDLRVRISVVDSKDSERYLGGEVVRIGSGASTISLTLRPVRQDGSVLDQPFWRLKYRLEPVGGGIISSGVISLSDLEKDFFDIRVSAPAFRKEGQRVDVVCYAWRMLDGTAIKGVKIRAKLSYDRASGERTSPPQTVEVETGPDGVATFQLPVPDAKKLFVSDALTLEVTAKLRGITQSTLSSLRQPETPLTYLTTDKSLYQPGQVVHSRVLLLDRIRKVVPGFKVEAKLTNNDNEEVCAMELQTSKYGVASFDCKIPDGAKTGDFEIEFRSPDDDEVMVRRSLRVSRYELPTFRIVATSEKPYYLPGEKAKVSIQAQYLFGKPVSVGKGFIRRESESRWHAGGLGKYEMSQQDVPFEVDSAGNATLELDLKEAESLLDNSDPTDFKDLHYLASLTDDSSGRTEVSKFDIRLSMNPIHLRMISRNGTVPDRLNPIYINAEYADGTPLKCRGRLLLVHRWKREQFEVASFETNLRGVARLIENSLPGNLNVKALPLTDYEMRIEALDGNGLKGFGRDSFATPTSTVRVITDRTLYRPGQPIQVQVLSSREGNQVRVMLASRGKILETSIGNIVDGSFKVNFAYRNEFKETLSISAFLIRKDHEDDEGLSRSERQIVYPFDGKLRTSIELSSGKLQPGQEVSARLALAKPGRKNLQGVIGISVVDTALLQREHTEEVRGSELVFAFDRELLEGEGLGSVQEENLNTLDSRRPFDPDLDLVAEALLFRGAPSLWSDETGNGFVDSSGKALTGWMEKSLSAAQSAIYASASRSGVYPSSVQELRQVLWTADLDLDELKDPWGRNYRIEFKVVGAEDEVKFISPGVDGINGTDDDLVALTLHSRYFTTISDLLAKAVEIFEMKTGFPPLSEAEVLQAIGMSGISATRMVDRWGRPYNFAVTTSGSNFSLSLLSTGPDGKLDSGADVSGDDVVVGSIRLRPFSALRKQVTMALQRFYEVFADYPANPREFEMALIAVGVNPAELKDPNGNAIYLSVLDDEKKELKTRMELIREVGGKEKSVTISEPVITTNRRFVVSGIGIDGLKDSDDDYTVLTHVVTLNEAALVVAKEIRPARTAKTISSGVPDLLPRQAGGTIHGTIKDSLGDVIPGTTVTASLKSENLEYSTISDENGVYLLTGLKPGLYEVRATARGFKDAVVVGVVAKIDEAARIEFVLTVGAVSETVTISVEASNALATSTSTISMQLVSLVPGLVAVEKPAARSTPSNLPLSPISTPRVRKYFPETAYWAPEIETNKKGEATVKFNLPDNITTWKVRIIGSTADGEIAVAEADLVAFQPFFADVDTPKILTQGDEISEPVIVRNYQSREELIKVSIENASWLRPLGSLAVSKSVPAGGFSRTDFPLQFVEATRTAAVKALAIGKASSDAVERELVIHPDGQAQFLNSYTAFRDKGLFTLDTGDDAIDKSVSGALVVYPNLGAHILEGVTAILMRPHGCAEQTISSAYPSAIASRLLDSLGAKEERKVLQDKTSEYLQQGYKKLQGYRRADGGYTYWGSGDANLALTAYALEFLLDTKQTLEFSIGEIRQTQETLLKEQQPNGGWLVPTSGARPGQGFDVRTASTIVRSLASDPSPRPEVRKGTERGLAYLRHWMEIAPEPYSLANYLFSAQALGEKDSVNWAVEKLKSAAVVDGGSTHWEIDYATPYYGWGLAGQVETTALVLRAMSKVNGKENSLGLNQIIESGLTWLMKHKDEEGMWRSSQATVSVYRALENLITQGGTETGGKAKVTVNGKDAAVVDLPSGSRVTSPIRVELDALLKNGANAIEIKRDAEGGYTTAQARLSYYRPWAGVKEGGALVGERFLDLSVKFDRTEAVKGEVVRCDVVAARVGRYGWGMMVAEIGLPPGAEVEKADLEALIAKRTAGVDHYEIQPDKLILYLWPYSGESRFSFTFKPRLAMKAKSAPSILYDYYNPDAYALVKPLIFTVK